MLSLLRVFTCESMILGLVSKHWKPVFIHFCYMFAHINIYFRLHLLLIIIHITCISLSLRWTSAPIHLTSVLGVLGTQETSCIIIAGLFERDTFDLFLTEFHKPWVIHLRETCCCSTNLCTWRPNTIYKNRSVVDINDLHHTRKVFGGCNDPRFYQILGENFRFYFACVDWKFTEI
jgi:hypothetical protein